MIGLIVSLALFVAGLVLSLSIYVASVASVMKLYEVINESWWVIWQYPVLFGVVWLLLTVLHVVYKHIYLNKKLDN